MTGSVTPRIAFAVLLFLLVSMGCVCSAQTQFRGAASVGREAWTAIPSVTAYLRVGSIATTWNGRETVPQLGGPQGAQSDNTVPSSMFIYFCPLSSAGKACPSVLARKSKILRRLA